MSTEFLGDRRQALEEAFFHKENQRKLEELRAAQARKATAQELREASGLADERVLEEIAALGIEPQTLAAVALAPLVLVAWANGTVEDEERAAVLRRAHDNGVEVGSPAYELLSSWLQSPPADALVDAWIDYVGALCDSMALERADELETEVMAAAREVANASGGYLGVGRIDRHEQRVLDRLASAFSRS